MMAKRRKAKILCTCKSDATVLDDHEPDCALRDHTQRAYERRKLLGGTDKPKPPKRKGRGGE